MRPDDENGSGGTLSGNKKDVYIYLKIAKLLHGVSMTSFSLKFAVDRGLPDKRYETMPVGDSIRRVLRFYTIRDKLHGVNKHLADIGVKEIKVDFDTEEVEFVFSPGKSMNKVFLIQFQYFRYL